MSTNWHFECVSHNPPVLDDLSGLNHGDAELAALWRRRAELNALPPDVELTDIVLSPYASFLRQHPHCDIRLRNEYGDTKDPASGTISRRRHCATCRCGTEGTT